jgi:hypothetical protein
MLRDLIAAGGALVLVAIVPWHLWLSAHDFHGDIPVGKGLTPGFLLDRTERVRPALDAVFKQLTANAFPALFVGLGLALALLWLIGRGRWLAPLFYAGAGVAYFASLIWAYWISPLEIGFHLQTSADRVALGVAFIALAGVLYLASESIRATR